MKTGSSEDFDISKLSFEIILYQRYIRANHNFSNLTRLDLLKEERYNFIDDVSTSMECLKFLIAPIIFDHDFRIPFSSHRPFRNKGEEAMETTWNEHPLCAMYLRMN